MRYKVLFMLVVCSVVCASGFMIPAKADEVTDAKIAELRAKIDMLTKQAEQFRGTVLEKQKEADTLKRQIDILNNQIKALEAQIDATDDKIALTKLTINDVESKLFENQKNIGQQKASIAQAMAFLYEHDRTDMVAAFVQHTNLSDFVSQAQQVDDWNERLSMLIKQLQQQKAQMEERKGELQKKQSELETLSDKQEAQRLSLANNKSSQSQLLKVTKGQEALYQKLLSDTEKQKATFFAEMQGLEQEVIADGRAIVHVTATAVPARGTKIFQFPLHESYHITQGYGMTVYAKRGAYGGAIHNGVDIANGCGNSIYAIGSGTVIASGNNAGFGNWIAIKHDAGGGMVSIYGHMVRGTTLTNGTKVTTDSVLGYEGTTGTSTGCHVHLSLYKDFFTYNNPKNGQLYFNYANGSVSPLDYTK